MRRILYLFDESARSGSSVISSLEGARSDEIILCPMSSNSEYKEGIVQQFRNLTARVNVLDFLKLFNKTALSAKDTYVKFISDFANLEVSKGCNIKQYFKFPFKDFSVWWFSLIAEKSTLKTDSYQRLIKILTILDISNGCHCDEIWLDISDYNIASLIMRHYAQTRVKAVNLRRYSIKRRLSGSARPILMFISALARFKNLTMKTFFVRKSMGDSKDRKMKLEKSDFLLVTCFPLLDEDRLKENVFIDRYYQPLQAALAKDYKGRFSWLGMILEFAGYDLKKSTGLAKQVNDWGDNFICCEEFLNLRDLVVVLWGYFYTYAKFLLKKSWIINNFRYPGIKTNLWPIFANDWFLSFGGWHLIDGIASYRVFRNLRVFLKEDAKVLYLAEMYSWEKALNIALNGPGRIRTVGIQHATIPLLLLNYFNDKSELLSGDNIQKMPVSDYLACAGRIPARFLEDTGWPKEKIFILGALRFQHLKILQENRIEWQDRKNIVLVALSIMSSEAKELLEYVCYAFRDQRDFKVLIKGHPANPIAVLLETLDIKIDGDIFQITDRPTREILPSAKAAIVTATSVSLEAFACQCPVITPELVKALNLSPLAGVSDLPMYVDSPQALRDTTQAIIKSKVNPIPFEKCQTLIKDYFDILDYDEEFLRRIERLN